MTLSEGWVEALVGDLVEPIEVGDPTAEPDRAFRYVDIGSIDNQRQLIEAPKELLGRDAPSRARRRIRKGDVLFSTVRPYLKNIAQVPEFLDGEFTSTGICVLRAKDGIQPGYLFRRVTSQDFIDAMTRASDGTMYPAIADRDVLTGEIALPPTAEQRRIVAKLDALTARLARARAELDRVPILVAGLKRSVLSRAFSKELTADWRARNGRKQEGWSVCTLGSIADVQGGIQVGKKRPAGTVLIDMPYLRVANVQRGWLKLEEIKTIGITADERSRLMLRDGDILMNEGGDRDKLGRGWVWRGEVADCIHQNHVFRIRLKDARFPPEFVSHYANEFGQAYFIDQGTQTTNLASISKSRVMALPVPLPEADEAIEIVRLITAAFARADRLEAEAARARALIDRLESAILAKAFRGELVPQDPNDEPAYVLLDRIRAERAAAPKAKRGRAARASV